MAKQSFTAGQVLTAAQQNALQLNDYNQTVSTKTVSYVLVAADAGTRVVMNSASATTITVNTSLFAAGDTLTILNIGAGVCTITAGTATVSSSASLALAQYGGGTLYFTSAGDSVFQAGDSNNSALTLISTTTIGSAVSSVTVSNAFSAAYDSYKIIVSGGSASAGNAMKMTFGSTITSYYSFIVYGSYTGNTVLGLAQSADTSFATIGGYETDQLFANIDVTAPFLTETTEVRGSVRYLTVYGNFVGALANGTSYTAFTLSPAGAHTWTGGTVRVYGYKNS